MRGDVRCCEKFGDGRPTQGGNGGQRNHCRGRAVARGNTIKRPMVGRAAGF